MIEEHGWPGGISVPDLILPEQYFADRKGNQQNPYRRLMLEVLMQAIHDYQGKSREAYQRDAAIWIRAVDAPGPFGFDNLCHYLDLDPGSVRRALWRGEVAIPRVMTTLHMPAIRPARVRR